jgi:flagellar assembly protein FliH
MSTATTKFLFDVDFAAPKASKPSITLVEHDERIKAAEAAAYKRGFEQAAAESKASMAQRSATAVERVGALVEGLNRSLAGISAKLETDAIQIAVAVARKLAPELIAREPMAEISALATSCFRLLVGAPHVVVHINDALRETAAQQLEELVRRSGLQSRLIILAEPNVAPGDCKIEWADGGINRDSTATCAAIDDAVAGYIKARLAAAPLQGATWRQKQ